MVLTMRPSSADVSRSILRILNCADPSDLCRLGWQLPIFLDLPPPVQEVSLSGFSRGSFLIATTTGDSTVYILLTLDEAFPAGDMAILLMTRTGEVRMRQVPITAYEREAMIVLDLDNVDDAIFLEALSDAESDGSILFRTG